MLIVFGIVMGASLALILAHGLTEGRRGRRWAGLASIGRYGSMNR